MRADKLLHTDAPGVALRAALLFLGHFGQADTVTALLNSNGRLHQ